MRLRKILFMLGICSMVAVVHCIPVSAEEWKSADEMLEIVKENGYKIIENYETKKTEETSCQLFVETVCPEGFGLNTYVMLVDIHANIYRISLSAENDHKDKIYLAPGEYRLGGVAVYDDFKLEYPFDVEFMQFTLSENENKSLSFVMKELKEQETESVETEVPDIGETDLREDEVPNTVVSDEVYYGTGMEGVTMQGSGILCYAVDHKGVGAGSMKVSGHATGDYDVVVKIVKSGVLGEAVFQISLDGGKTFIGQDVVAESSKIGDAGITLYFETEQDTVEFIKGDEYHVHMPETFPVAASKTGNANLIVTGHPLEEHDFVVTVLSSGGLGKSRFTVSSTKGDPIQVTDVIPEDGLYELVDDMVLVFSDSTAYERGLTYNVVVKSNEEAVNYTPLYVLLGIAATGAAVGISMMGSKKEKDSEYRMRRYQWQKPEQEYHK